MKKWNPFYSAPVTPVEPPPIPGAEWSILRHELTTRYPVPLATGNNWTKQLVPGPVEGHLLANYQAHEEVAIQAGWTNNDAILLQIETREVGTI